MARLSVCEWVVGAIARVENEAGLKAAAMRDELENNLIERRVAMTRSFIDVK
jgi:hypothetical protein